MAQRFDVVNGPCRFGLMTSLFDEEIGYKKAKKVKFRTPGIRVFNVRITGLLQESGGGFNWIFKGIAKDGQYVSGYFDVHRRKGNIVIPV